MPKNTSNTRQSSDTGSSLSELGLKIVHYIQAGYAGLYLVSPEEQRVEAELKAVLEHINKTQKQTEQFSLCYWSVVDGLVNTRTKEVKDGSDPLEILQTIGEGKERTIFLLK